ncbi:enoyl-CoA hydratase-related protein [Brevibacterium marinum]|uniref:Enoyl-CoA hydratase/carnithine racemase n=1 Tax=Brevibacterium marinum TaxID=418643 RepID=A0A846RQR9_9MICO|nr:enoyl-CoA hydratase-related protein [Brevibacterium marinum]NJC56314.1 enoyl-CoA hydratase/carnithine racemase [Brevibacterium marinum]
MIRQSIDNRVLTITIDDSSRANSLSADALVELRDAFAAASDRQDLGGVLFNAVGDKGFSAGMDTAQFDHTNSTQAFETITLLGSVCEAVKNCELPVALSMKGYVIGGAVEIAAAADFRVGGASSWYSMPEVRIGIPSVLESVNLHRLMGWTKANEMILTGNRYSAEAMERCGFLNTVVDDATVDEVALDYLRATMESDRSVIAQQKRLFRTWKNTFEDEAITDSCQEFSLAFARKND